MAFISGTPFLYHISTGQDIESGRIGEHVCRLSEEGMYFLQIRDRSISARELNVRCDRLRQDMAWQSVQMILNDRVDIALATKMDGVHVPARGIPVKIVRRLVPPGFLVGRSCHSLTEVLIAEDEGADYVLLSPIFPTSSKPGAKGLGLEELSRITARTQVPIIALGGMNAEVMTQTLAAGAAGIGGIRCFRDPLQARRMAEIAIGGRTNDR